MKKIAFLLCLSVISSAQNIDYNAMIKEREKFFTEAIAQKYDASKISFDSINKDSISPKNANFTKLPYIDFCAYPPDRSLTFGPLNKGRFHGEKISDLPFSCDKSSGARKFFIKDSNISQSYHILRFNYSKLLLNENLPRANSSETFSINNVKNELHYIWQNVNGKNDRLWVIYSGGMGVLGGSSASENLATMSRYTLIFTQKGKDVEVILQYLNL